MLEQVIERTDKFIDTMTKTERKKIGQFFTSPATARFMASLYDVPDKAALTVLDAGAGSGILSAPSWSGWTALPPSSGWT